LFISTVGAMMFSMKSICDNMIWGSLGKKREDNEEVNINQDTSTQDQKVEIK
jgi:hypothetical protein